MVWKYVPLTMKSKCWFFTRVIKFDYFSSQCLTRLFFLLEFVTFVFIPIVMPRWNYRDDMQEWSVFSRTWFSRSKTTQTSDSPRRWICEKVHDRGNNVFFKESWKIVFFKESLFLFCSVMFFFVIHEPLCRRMAKTRVVFLSLSQFQHLARESFTLSTSMIHFWIPAISPWLIGCESPMISSSGARLDDEY